MRRVLATDFGIWPLFKGLERVSDAMVLSEAQWGALANYVLLYDQIVIPTGNLQILPVLRIMLGEGVFDELVRNNVIVLARYDRWFSYVGNGGGLRFFEIAENPSGQRGFANIFHSYFAPLDEAIETALIATTPSSSKERKNELTKLLTDKIVSVATDVEMNAFRDETYKDILGSPYLRDLFSIRNRGRSLDRLRGIQSNQVRIYSPHSQSEDEKGPEITSLLRVAFENFILSIGTDVSATEITGDGSTLALLKAKGQRVGAAIDGFEAFARIQEISGVPDIGAAFAKKSLTAEQLLDLRESKHAISFRQWIGSGADGENADEIVRRYIGEIGKPSLIESIPVKMLRFVTTTGIGALEPISGAAASAVDSFLLSKWFPGKSPRLFLKQAKSVLLKSVPQTEAVPIPRMSGRDRNRPCSCGSGKKYKHCCGR